jgi:hypothetical protein
LSSVWFVKITHSYIMWVTPPTQMLKTALFNVPVYVYEREMKNQMAKPAYAKEKSVSLDSWISKVKI